MTSMVLMDSTLEVPNTKCERTLSACTLNLHAFLSCPINARAEWADIK
jgi:hypothetical protein